MRQFLKPLGITLTDEQLNKFETYYNFLLQENAKYNLTALKTKEDIYIKHFYDSATLLKTEKLENINMLDIGSGAGFPAIPIKIISNNKITMVESQTKKANFLNAVIKELEIDGKVINKRVEDLDKSYLNSFDIVTARAVAALNILIELSVPFVKIGGYFIAMKGDSYEKEIFESKHGIIKLSCTIEDIIELNLPNNMGRRSLIIIKKNKEVKGYPRPYSQIIKKPLGSDLNE